MIKINQVYSILGKINFQVSIQLNKVKKLINFKIMIEIIISIHSQSIIHSMENQPFLTSKASNHIVILNLPIIKN